MPRSGMPSFLRHPIPLLAQEEHVPARIPASPRSLPRPRPSTQTRCRAGGMRTGAGPTPRGPVEKTEARRGQGHAQAYTPAAPDLDPGPAAPIVPRCPPSSLVLSSAPGNSFPARRGRPQLRQVPGRRQGGGRRTAASESRSRRHVGPVTLDRRPALRFLGTMRPAAPPRRRAERGRPCVRPARLVLLRAAPPARPAPRPRPVPFTPPAREQPRGLRRPRRRPPSVRLVQQRRESRADRRPATIPRPPRGRALLTWAPRDRRGGPGAQHHARPAGGGETRPLTAAPAPGGATGSGGAETRPL